MSFAELVELLKQYGEQDDDVQVDLDESHREESLRDLGFDSLGIFNMVVRVSEKSGVEIPYDDVAGADTPADLLGVINNALSVRNV